MIQEESLACVLDRYSTACAATLSAEEHPANRQAQMARMMAQTNRYFDVAAACLSIGGSGMRISPTRPSTWTARKGKREGRPKGALTQGHELSRVQSSSGVDFREAPITGADDPMVAKGRRPADDAPSDIPQELDGECIIAAKEPPDTAIAVVNLHAGYSKAFVLADGGR
jgi:hypothetical protein